MQRKGTGTAPVSLGNTISSRKCTKHLLGAQALAGHEGHSGKLSPKSAGEEPHTAQVSARGSVTQLRMEYSNKESVQGQSCMNMGKEREF